MFWKIYNSIITIALLVVALMACSGCYLLQPSKRPRPQFSGPDDLVQRVRAAKAMLDHRFGVTYDANLRCRWYDVSDYDDTEFRYGRLLEIRIDPMWKHDRQTLQKRIQHEMCEAFVYRFIGTYEEFHQPQVLNGVRIVDVVADWNNQYQGE